MEGFGTLMSAKDLCGKLEHDFRLIEADPGSTYAAYNFFVTAEHMLDWLYPGDQGTSGAASRTAERESGLLLRVVSNIANGAKHFKPNPKRHDSVTHIDHSDSPYGSGAYGAGPYGGGLIISLDGPAAANYGTTISALELARYVLDHWRAHSALQ